MDFQSTYASFVMRQVAVLLGLRCDVDRDWACALLSVLGPRLESLQLLAPLQEHLQVRVRLPITLEAPASPTPFRLVPCPS